MHSYSYPFEQGEWGCHLVVVLAREQDAAGGQLEDCRSCAHVCHLFVYLFISSHVCVCVFIYSFFVFVGLLFLSVVPARMGRAGIKKEMEISA